MPGVVAFTKVALPGGWMGNMSPHPVEYRGRLVKTTEHLFQCLRFGPDLTDEVSQTILAKSSPFAAKLVAKTAISRGLAVVEPRSEADLANMRLVVGLKIDRHPTILEDLAATDAATLIEDTSSRHDKFWGARRAAGADERDKTGLVPWQAGDGSWWLGRNELGKIWEAERDRRRLL